jgi:hypothetical protein
MVRQLCAPVAIDSAAIPPACGELGRKRGDLAARLHGHERSASQRDSGIQKVAVSNGELS